MRKAKNWLKEIVVGVSGTVVGAMVLAAMGINSEGKVASTAPQPGVAEQRTTLDAGSSVPPLLSLASSLTLQPNEPPPTQGFREQPQQQPAASLLPSLIGKWEQWIYHPEHQQWYSGGIYRVTIKQQRLAMSILDNTDVVPEMINSQGLADVTYENGVWSFYSQLEIGEVLHFKLRCIDEDTFSGHCHQDGQTLSANTWRRVKQ